MRARTRPRDRRPEVATAPRPSDGDERETQFDLRRLEPGDLVEVFLERERQWVCATFRVSTVGEPWIDVFRREKLDFDQAVAMGLKRILH